MPLIGHVRDLFDYNYWRNHKILAHARKIQPWQFAAPTTYPYVSLHGTLMHTAGAEWPVAQPSATPESPTGIAAKDGLPDAGCRC